VDIPLLLPFGMLLNVSNSFRFGAVMSFVLPTYTENLAAGKNTSQSSTYGNGQSWKSVDGNLDMWDSDWQCSHTLEDNPSWWRVDLGSNNVPVYEVLIVNRFSQHDSVRQRSQDYKITLGESFFKNVNRLGKKDT